MRHTIEDYFKDRREARQHLCDMVAAASPDARTYTADYMDTLDVINRAHPCAIAYTVNEGGAVDDPRRLSEVYAAFCKLLYEWANNHTRSDRLWRFTRVIEYPPRAVHGGRLHVVLLFPRADMYHILRVAWLE